MVQDKIFTKYAVITEKQQLGIYFLCYIPEHILSHDTDGNDTDGKMTVLTIEHSAEFLNLGYFQTCGFQLPEFPPVNLDGWRILGAEILTP